MTAQWLANEEARRTAGLAAREWIVHLSGGVATSLRHLRALIAAE